MSMYGKFFYSTVVGMMLYFDGHTCSDIAYSEKCSARYTFGPKNFHELALKRVGCYLNSTPYKLLMLNPHLLF